jgi:hypothetical protein
MTTVKSPPGTVVPTLVTSRLSRFPDRKTGKANPSTELDIVEFAAIKSEQRRVPATLMFNPMGEPAGGVLTIA